MPTVAYLALPIQLDEDNGTGTDSKQTQMASSVQSRGSVVSSTLTAKEEEVSQLLAGKLGVDPSSLILHSFTAAHLTPKASPNSGAADPASQEEDDNSSAEDKFRCVAFLSPDDCMTLLAAGVAGAGVLGGGAGNGAANITTAGEGVDPNGVSVGSSTFGGSNPVQDASQSRASGNGVPTGKSVTGGEGSLQRVQELEAENASLKAELEDLRGKVEEINAFKAEVLSTIKGMKQEVASIGEDVLLGDDGEEK